MKVAIALSLLIAAITALPQQSTTAQLVVEGIKQNDERIVTGSIIAAIEDAKQNIQDAGLDPFYRQNIEFNYALPVPVLFNAQIVAEEVLLTGLSNIVVHNMNFSIITSRLTFDIRLPLLEFTLGKAVKQATAFGSSTESYVSGRFAIVGVRLDGNVRVSIGIISGISLRSLDLDFSLGGIESGLNIVVHGKDISDAVNKFAGDTVPRTLNEYSSEINELLEIVVTQIIEDNL